MTIEAEFKPEFIGIHPDYFVTVSTDSTGAIVARQINNVVSLTLATAVNLSKILVQGSLSSINISPDQLTSLDPVFYPNPINLVFFSSVGAMYGAEMTVKQPSDGMWALSEILARENPQVSCLCIDPNIIGYDDIRTRLLDLKVDRGQTVFGISSLVQNFPNESVLINKMMDDFPQARIVIGGIGANTLSLLPTTDGKPGIETVWNNAITIPGVAILELQELFKLIYENPNISTDILRHIVSEQAKKYSDDNWEAILANLQQARINSRSFFMPLENNRQRLFFDQSYAEMRTGHSMSMAVTDNNCKYKCWFCATPKDSRFSNREDELAFIVEVASDQIDFAFSNNDLAADPDKTIWLCEQMAQNPDLQLPKHGKMSAASFHLDLIDALAQAGFVRIAVGVETFNLRHRMQLKGNKFEDPESVNQTLAQLLRVGITPEINLILFHPNETTDSLLTTADETLRWVQKGVIVNATLGVNAIPNSYAVKRILENLKFNQKPSKIRQKMGQLFEVAEITGQNGKSILFPVQWLTKNPDIQQLKFTVREQRLKIIHELNEKYGEIIRQNYVPIESYLALLLIQASINGNKVDLKQITTYISQFSGKTYVGI